MSSDEPIKMLSIDDKSLTTSLDRAGYREMGVLVSSAASSQEAFEILKTKHIDIVVINLDYGKSDPELVCRHIRQNEQLKNIPIVLTSVQAKVNLRKNVMDAGANLFVEQPIPRTYFIEKLKQLLTKETRGNGRVASTGLGTVKMTINAEDFEFSIGDLSISGMLVSTKQMFPLGSQLVMEFQVPGYKKPLRVEGEIVRHVSPTPKHPEREIGIGVRFQTFSGDSEKRLQKYLENANLDSKQMQYYL